jgi:hypothetical protein
MKSANAFFVRESSGQLANRLTKILAETRKLNPDG